MLSYQEMITVADRHYKHTTFGGRYDVVGIRKELAYGWGLDELQVQRVIWDMKDRAII